MRSLLRYWSPVACVSFTLDTSTPCWDDTGYNFKKIVVAYDASPAAESALHDAINLGRRFGSELLLAQVDPPQLEQTMSYVALRDERYSKSKDLGADQ
jgi:hypothetical protein